jgi:fatty acid desaturase
MLWFKHPDAVTPNLLLFSYLVLAYPLALLGLAWPGLAWPGIPSPLWFAASVLLMANALVLFAYLLHDCLHNNVFATVEANERLGKVLAWLVGAVYSPYAVLREKHFRHHIERADILAVNYRHVLRRHALLDRCVRWSTWAYFPAVDILLQWLELLAPLYLQQRRHLRRRNLVVFAVRTGMFGVLCYLNPLAVAGYVIAWLLFLSVLGFMDAFQHSYDIHYRLLGPQQKPARDKLYEEHNTYSNLLSSRYPSLNLLVLNFCYHNVHHQKPSEPWYRLPGLHRRLYPDGCAQRVPLATQLAHFRRYRLERIHHADNARRTGADGVSFLVGV